MLKDMPLPFVYNSPRAPFLQASTPTSFKAFVKRYMRETHIICKDMNNKFKFVQPLEMGRKDSTGEKQASFVQNYKVQ